MCCAVCLFNQKCVFAASDWASNTRVFGRIQLLVVVDSVKGTVRSENSNSVGPGRFDNQPEFTKYKELMIKPQQAFISLIRQFSACGRDLNSHDFTSMHQNCQASEHSGERAHSQRGPP